MRGEEIGVYFFILGIFLINGKGGIFMQKFFSLSLRVCCFKDVKEIIKYDCLGGCIFQKDCLG